MELSYVGRLTSENTYVMDFGGTWSWHIQGDATRAELLTFTNVKIPPMKPRMHIYIHLSLQSHHNNINQLTT